MSTPKSPKDLVTTKFVNRQVNGKNQGYNANSPVNNLNALVEMMYYRNLTELAAGRFKWTGLPDTVDERYLELTLYQRALAVFYEDHDFGYLAQAATGSGEINIYDNALSYDVTLPRTGTKTISHKQCVPIWANYLRIPDYDIVRVYTEKLAKIDSIIDIAIENLRFTKVVMVEENQRQSYTNLLRQHQSGQPIIFGNKNLDLANIAAFDVGAHPEALGSLMVAKSKMWNDCMTYLGIDNSNQEKKERLVESEVSANDAQIVSMQRKNLNARQQACDQINKMFDLDIWVEFHTEDNTGPLASATGTKKEKPLKSVESEDAA